MNIILENQIEAAEDNRGEVLATLYEKGYEEEKVDVTYSGTCVAGYTLTFRVLTGVQVLNLAKEIADLESISNEEEYVAQARARLATEAK
jgi:hypothetical protein